MANSINVALNGKVVKIHTKIISVEDFLNEKRYKENPRQRNTLKRLKSKHLNGDVSPDQTVVHVAKFGSSLFIIDGYSRREAWKVGNLTRPENLIAVIYHVNSILDVTDLYTHFDSELAREKPSEVYYGNMKMISFNPGSELMKASWATAIKYVAAYYGVQQVSNTETVKYLNDFKNELEQIDSLEVQLKGVVNAKRKYSSGIRAAMLITLRLYGDAAFSFWEDYNDYCEGMSNKYVTEVYQLALQAGRGAQADKLLMNQAISLVNYYSQE